MESKPEQFKAMVFLSPGRMEIKDIAYCYENIAQPSLKHETFIIPSDKRGEINEHYVLIQVRGVGICGTDIHMYYGKRFNQEIADHDHPLIAGHELFGRVIEAGKQYTSLLGQEVVVDGIIDCYNGKPCHFCNSGNNYRHEPFSQMGICGNVPGGFINYTVALGKNCYPLTQKYSLEEKAILELLACLTHAFHDKLCPVPDASTYLVFGGGPAGLLTVQLIHLLNPKNRVILVEPIALKREKAKLLGADEVVWEDDHEKLIRRVKKLNGRGADYIIEVSGAVKVFSLIPHLAAPLANVLIFGLGYAPFDIGCLDSYIEKEIKLITTLGPSGPNSFKNALEIVKKIKVSEIFTHHFVGIENLQNALKTTKCEYDSYIKGVVTF